MDLLASDIDGSGVLDRKPDLACLMIRFPHRSGCLRRMFALARFAVISFLLTFGLAAAERMLAWQPSPLHGIKITEFYYNPPGLDKEREWVEIANLGNQSVQLSGYGLGDEEGPGGGEAMLRFPEGSEIGASEAIVVAQTAVGFRALFGASPDYEIQGTDTAVPDMIADSHWASGQFALANNGDEIILINNQDNIVDTINYGDRTTFFTPTVPLVVPGQSIERVPANCDTDSAGDWLARVIPTPGELVLKGSCASPPDQDNKGTPQLLTIGDIQGSGDVSPLLNQIVTFRGLVTGALEDQNASGVIYNTLFVQDVPGFEDGDPATSDAIAVFLGRRHPQYNIGDQITVTGQVTEYFGLTEIDDKGLSIERGTPSQTFPYTTTIELPRHPETTIVYLEAHEGMLVGTGEPLPVWGPTHSGCGFALGSTPGATRPLQHSGLEDYAPPILVLNQSDVDCSDLPALKTGDLVTGIAGPLTFHFEQYKVVQQHSESLKVESVPATFPDEPAVSSSDILRIATFNLDNYLVPSSDQEEYSSDRPTLEETEIKKRKLAYTISHTLGCPQIIGVQEVESEALLLDLAAATDASCNFLYQVTHQDSPDGRGIDVALLSDPDRVSVEAAELHQICSPLATGVHDSNINCAPGEEPLFSRPPLEVTLRVDDKSLTIIVNHFKSKRGGAVETAPRRLAQARLVNDLVRNRLANDPEAGIIVLGDFNDYNLSSVWQRLQDAGVLYDAMQQLPANDRYSYIFDGASQLVDGVLVSPALVHHIESVNIAHVNADYPFSLALDASPAGLPFHASDHDPVLLTLHEPSHSQMVNSIPVERLQTSPPPIVTARPTAVSTVAAEASVAPQSYREKQPENSTRSIQYVLITGLAILFAAMTVCWLVRRASR